MPRAACAPLASPCDAGRLCASRETSQALVTRKARFFPGAGDESVDRLQRRLDIRVGLQLMAEGAGRAVAGEKVRLAGQSHDAPDGRLEVGVVRIRKVGAPDGPADDQVPADEHAGVLE